ncbi:type I restriction endonuclease [Mesorhizobium sp.]|uniref:type I restriction endonuclease subunit R n=1 Tax=Mesorhizobium sp. TaxID=1871066 RepID=UPI000FE70DD0|nr:type I restriction endonuclease [Mesorhizobium sp.]RWK63813.1 MAG: type I restriction endonuclease subunit R [Mesorhizobium sp.]RWM50873.1 MAG: type I restriction endonuclease subunit R [Mesorhizobium sp.]RWM57570.1 MAG: type I restriction endonuclease subunit R [Mesorhizobium sp.]RWM58948.1 MAG: type I restriction endonuclease subunit R [Mesorhizobium sp.]RWM99755.1 MAG: type I restriction endonuclease subunit R [Mesorhizobium sp.]
MNLHQEISFEAEICDHLAANGWLYTDGEAAAFDRVRALFPADVVAWVRASQPNAWDTLTKSHGAAAESLLLDRIRKQLDERGMLDVIRHGVEMIGLRAPLALAQFKPALAMNADILARYQANRLRVVRQVRYSLANENAIDLVLFLNGLPVATVELKTDFTQSVADAVDQYKFDRLPNPKGRAPEPLLSFPSGALVHFAVSNAEVVMTSRLEGPETRFLPVNKGNGGGRGNPPNPEGHPTAYLWEGIWQRDSWLEILGRYIVAERDAKKKIRSVIFPRFHQLDATRKLRASVLAEGAGGKYLIQHSAGSGKTNSIAWTAHFLADLHDDKHEKVFHTVLVVSDRNVIDTQLQEAIFNFERTTGVVTTIKSDSGAKSGQLAEALAGGKKIVVCTIQTFPFALKAVQDLAASQGKRFAVIADEAHSSQTGEAAAKLKAVLSPEELADLGDGGEVSSEDILAAQMAARASAKGITYVAFTATPKAKTLELFGRRPFPDQAVSETNLPAAFHVYSMRQAIEEGFILDVLRNYTPYSLAFKLAHEGKEIDDTEVERSAAVKSLMRWVRLHDYNISQKVQVVVEHYRSLVQPLLHGKAKAMVVVGSRIEAVRWQLAINKYIKEKGYRLGTLVAFSGEVNDQTSGPDPFSETSKELNPGLNGRDIREAFKLPEYHILLVANKFQTGFDQPLLCGMYVDRRLAGIQAVQTLSRLNRAHPGKDTTYVLDFVNSSDDILKAFQTYYETASLENVTDPNLVFDLRAKLDGLGHYDEFEVERVVKVELDPTSKQGDLVAAITPVVDRLLRFYRDAQERLRIARSKDDAKAARDAQDTMDALVLFRADMGAFVRLYAFLSQIFDYGNTAIERRHIFFRRLIPLLEFGRERQEIDVSGLVLTHHKLADKGKRTLALGGFGEPLQPIYDAGSGSVQEKQKALLAEIVAKLNDLFQGVDDGDQVRYVMGDIKDQMLKSETLEQQAVDNSKEQFANSPDILKCILNAIMDAGEAHSSLSKQALNSAKVREGLKDILLGPGQLWETLRQQREQEDISI